MCSDESQKNIASYFGLIDERMDPSHKLQTVRVCIHKHFYRINNYPEINLQLRHSQSKNFRSTFFSFSVILNPKRHGGSWFNPLVGRSPAISHRIILWSQKLLTLSINIPTRSYFLLSWQVFQKFSRDRAEIMIFWDRK